MEDKFARLRPLLADVRSLYPGGSAGVIQLMDPSLGAAVAAQSDFFDDPFGRVYRSIPQIWATVLTPEGPARAVGIRDVHRGIRGTDGSGRSYRALDVDTFWWAHATFTWEVFESVRLFYPGGLDRIDSEALYQETVCWYELYGMSTRPVPATYAEFQSKFDRICREHLEMTPASRRVLDLALAGRWRLPLVRIHFHDPFFKRAGRAMILGCLPPIVRERFGLPFTRLDRWLFGALCFVIRNSSRFIPAFVRHRGLETALRFVGNKTRPERYSPSLPRESTGKGGAVEPS